MFNRFHEMKEDREQGFTLIELLVVILIIAILAAIAIPVFLNQRKKGWASAAQSALKNAATNQESYATGNDGLYANTMALVETEGYNPTADVTLITRTDAAGTKFCLQARHRRGETGWAWKLSTWESDEGEPNETVELCSTTTYSVGEANQAA